MSRLVLLLALLVSCSVAQMDISGYSRLDTLQFLEDVYASLPEPPEAPLNEVLPAGFERCFHLGRIAGGASCDADPDCAFVRPKNTDNALHAFCCPESLAKFLVGEKFVIRNGANAPQSPYSEKPLRPMPGGFSAGAVIGQALVWGEDDLNLSDVHSSASTTSDGYSYWGIFDRSNGDTGTPFQEDNSTPGSCSSCTSLGGFTGGGSCSGEDCPGFIGPDEGPVFMAVHSRNLDNGDISSCSDYGYDAYEGCIAGENCHGITHASENIAENEGPCFDTEEDGAVHGFYFEFDMSSIPADPIEQNLFLSLDVKALGNFDYEDRLFVFVSRTPFDNNEVPMALVLNYPLDDELDATYTFEGGTTMSVYDPMMAGSTVLNNEWTSFESIELPHLDPTDSDPIYVSILGSVYSPKEGVAIRGIKISQGPLEGSQAAIYAGPYLDDSKSWAYTNGYCLFPSNPLFLDRTSAAGSSFVYGFNDCVDSDGCDRLEKRGGTNFDGYDFYTAGEGYALCNSVNTRTDFYTALASCPYPETPLERQCALWAQSLACASVCPQYGVPKGGLCAEDLNSFLAQCGGTNWFGSHGGDLELLLGRWVLTPPGTCYKLGDYGVSNTFDRALNFDVEFEHVNDKCDFR